MRKTPPLAAVGILSASVAAVCWLAPSDAPAAEPGQLAFNNRCRTCHSVRESDNRLGPSLHGIVGSKAGASSGYPNYSQSLTNSGVVWNEETLNKFIENPESVIPGNNMKPYGGLSDEAERKEIVEYLKAQSGK